MRRKTIAITSLTAAIISLMALFFLLSLTNPSGGGPAIILLVLVLIYIFTFASFTLLALLCDYVYRLIFPRRQDATINKRLKRFYRRLLVVTSILALTPIFLISLNSIGKLGFIDVSLIVLTEVLAVFYALKYL